MTDDAGDRSEPGADRRVAVRRRLDGHRGVRVDRRGSAERRDENDEAANPVVQDERRRGADRRTSGPHGQPERRSGRDRRKA